VIRLRVDAARLVAGELVVTGDDHHYLSRVLRVSVGTELALFDGAGRHARGVVVAATAEHLVVRVDEPRAAAPPSPRIAVLQPLLKGERMDWCLEKLVETGADEILIIAAERSVVRLEPERAAARQRRHQALAEAAARQCGRATVPPVSAVMPLPAALAAVASCARKLVCHPCADGPRAGGAIDHRTRTAADAASEDRDSAAILVGPEGGLAPGELDSALAAGFTPVGLGPYILRAETAGPIAVAMVRLLASDA